MSVLIPGLINISNSSIKERQHTLTTWFYESLTLIQSARPNSFFNNDEWVRVLEMLFTLSSIDDEMFDLLTLLKKKDETTFIHSFDVFISGVSFVIDAEIECELLSFSQALLFHDIGKIDIDDSILKKETTLTDEEYEKVKEHVELGYKRLTNIKKLSPVVPFIALSHHENSIGTGYPNGLLLSETTKESRISTIVDIFSALSLERPYKKAFDIEETAEELSNNENLFDPELLWLFLKFMKKRF